MQVRPLPAGLAAVTATWLFAACAPSGDTPAAGPAGAPVTSATKIASAGVLGNQRRPDESCPAEPARTDPAPAPDPQRIVALAAGDLDALCALGLQTRIVAAALPDGGSTPPSYLGTVVRDVPAAGTRGSPDQAAVAAARPDLILVPQAEPALSAIAPTVPTAAPGGRWPDNLRAVGAATGRREAAEELIAGFAAQARQAGAANDAVHFQASVVQFTATAMRVWGAENFPASVLAAVGVDRPPAQRFTDRPYLEIPFDSPDFSAADGDIVYLSFDSPAARERAPEILEGAAWRKLSANRDNRVFAVNNEIWQTGQGVVAARGILEDLRWLNAPIN